jgi:hypothetical protein
VAPGERVAAIGEDAAGMDRLAEWAPYLAGAPNPIVPQGREWLGDAAATEARAEILHRALLAGAEPLQAWLAAAPRVHWLVVGSESGQDPRVARTLATFADAGSGRLVCQRGAATVWQVR